MVPFLMVAIAAGFLGSYIVVSSVSNTFEERFENQLVESSRSASDALVRREQKQLETIRSLLFTDGFTRALTRGETGTLLSIAMPIAANNGTELVEVIGPDGVPLISLAMRADGELAPVPETVLESRAGWDAVAMALGGIHDKLGDRHAQLAVGPSGLAMYTAAPVYGARGIVGVVMVGSPLATLLPDLKGASLADLTFYTATGDAIASTFDLTEASEWEALAIRSAIPGGRTQREVAGRGYEVLLSELRLRNEVFGFQAVALPQDFITFAEGQTGQQLALLVGGGALVMVGTGWLVARSLTAPLAALVKITSAMRGGDLTVRAGFRRHDEIGELAISFDHMADAMQRKHLGTLEALVSAIDARDAYTRGHSVRVGHLAETIGDAIGMQPSERQHLLVGGYLHDIGKIGVRDDVLLKPGALNHEERCAVEQHPTVGLQILAPVGLPQETLDAICQHHERLDGSGYPQGLKGSEVSTYARIVTVADVYDALITDRPYRAALGLSEVFRILESEVHDGKIDGWVVATLRRIAPMWEARRTADPILQGFELHASMVSPLDGEAGSRKAA